jgi:hypothetical protein
MEPLEAMVLAFEASGGDEPLGFEGRLLAALDKLGWGLREKPNAPHEHRWMDPDKLETICRDCGDVRKDDRQVRLTLRPDRPLYPNDPELVALRADRVHLKALDAAVTEYLATDGSAGLYHAGRMISARNTIYLLFDEADRRAAGDSTHAAFIPDDIEAMGLVMERVAALLHRTEP